MAAFDQTTVSGIAWSPDGTRLVFDASPQVLNDVLGPVNPSSPDASYLPTVGGYGIWMVDLNGTNLNLPRIVAPPAAHPSWRRASSPLP